MSMFPLWTKGTGIFPGWTKTVSSSGEIKFPPVLNDIVFINTPNKIDFCEILVEEKELFIIHGLLNLSVFKEAKKEIANLIFDLSIMEEYKENKLSLIDKTEFKTEVIKEVKMPINVVTAFVEKSNEKSLDIEGASVGYGNLINTSKNKNLSVSFG